MLESQEERGAGVRSGLEGDWEERAEYSSGGERMLHPLRRRWLRRFLEWETAARTVRLMNEGMDERPMSDCLSGAWSLESPRATLVP